MNEQILTLASKVYTRRDIRNHSSCKRQKNKIPESYTATQCSLYCIHFAWFRPLSLSLCQLFWYTSENVNDEKLARCHYSIIWKCKSWFVLDLFSIQNIEHEIDELQDEIVRARTIQIANQITTVKTQRLKSRIENGLSDN